MKCGFYAFLWGTEENNICVCKCVTVDPQAAFNS